MCDFNISTLNLNGARTDFKRATFRVALPRINDLEQYSRMEDLLISGLEIQWTFAQAVTGDKGEKNIPAPILGSGLSSLEDQVINIFESKSIFDSKDVAACHTFPQRNGRKPNTIICFANRNHKMEVLRNARKLKSTGIYVNEHLTKKNAEIARYARILRKEKKIQGTWTWNCKILIKLNGSPEQAQVIVKDLKDLDQYK